MSFDIISVFSEVYSNIFHVVIIALRVNVIMNANFDMAIIPMGQSNDLGPTSMPRCPIRFNFDIFPIWVLYYGRFLARVIKNLKQIKELRMDSIGPGELEFICKNIPSLKILNVSMNNGPNETEILEALIYAEHLKMLTIYICSELTMIFTINN